MYSKVLVLFVVSMAAVAMGQNYIENELPATAEINTVPYVLLRVARSMKMDGPNNFVRKFLRKLQFELNFINLNGNGKKFIININSVIPSLPPIRTISMYHFKTLNTTACVVKQFSVV